MKQINLFSLLLIPTIGIANICIVEGDPDKWIEYYCLVKNKTNNIETRIIKECMASENEKIRIASCEGNIIYKEKICELLIEQEKYKGNLNFCIEEKININELIQ